MLQILNDLGDQNDYNDDERVEGWFRWSIDPDMMILTVRYEPDLNTGDCMYEERWWLSPVHYRLTD
jgi:hypothetical protein